MALRLPLYPRFPGGATQPHRFPPTFFYMELILDVSFTHEKEKKTRVKTRDVLFYRNRLHLGAAARSVWVFFLSFSWKPIFKWPLYLQTLVRAYLSKRLARAIKDVIKTEIFDLSCIQSKFTLKLITLSYNVQPGKHKMEQCLNPNGPDEPITGCLHMLL